MKLSNNFNTAQPFKIVQIELKMLDKQDVMLFKLDEKEKELGRRQD